MTAPLVSFHITAYAESLPTTRLGALVRLLSRVAVTVNAQATGARKGFVAR